jgi:hypothetical protein
MKKTRILLLSFFFLFSWIIIAHGALLISLDLPKDITIPPTAQITGITYEKVLPEYGQCTGGEACFVMALSKYGIKKTQDDIHKASTRRKVSGSNARDLYASAMNLGITGEYYNIWGFKSGKDRKYYFDALKYYISEGYPVIILWNEDPKIMIDDFCSFALVVRYDDKTEQVTILDPYRGPEAGRVITYDDFLDQWQYDLSDGTYGLFMYVIEGQDRSFKEKLKTVSSHLESGESLDLVYNNLTPNKSFVILDSDWKNMAIWAEAKTADGELMWSEYLNDSESDWCWFMDVATYTLHFECRRGQGNVSATYNPQDGELYK